MKHTTIVYFACVLPVLGCSRYDNDERKSDMEMRFKRLARHWDDECKNIGWSSRIQSYLEQPSFEHLVDLGPQAIPYIMAEYKRSSLPWGLVLERITGISMVDDPNDFSPSDMKARWLNWWQQQEGEIH